MIENKNLYIIKSNQNGRIMINDTNIYWINMIPIKFKNNVGPNAWVIGKYTNK